MSITIEFFLEEITKKLDVGFFTGVPDSQLKALCDTLYAEYGVGDRHIVAANEGAAVGLGAGHFLATGAPALIYMQNSGMGNALNPMVSLMDEKVYKIPALYVIGFRGEPGEKDEPQHIFQGEITKPLLKLLKIPYFILSKDTTKEEFSQWIEEGREIIKEGRSIAFLVKKGGLHGQKKGGYGNPYKMTREEAIEIMIKEGGRKDIFVSTTGKASRELYEIREKIKEGHEKDFLTVGSMGHASMIALGIAMEKKERTVWCLDGDGAALMHLGSMAVAAAQRCTNLIHVVLNNKAHETVGGMPVNHGSLDFKKIGEAAGYEQSFQVRGKEELMTWLRKREEYKGTKLIEIMVALGAREDLGRPVATPQENKGAFMDFIKKG